MMIKCKQQGHCEDEKKPVPDSGLIHIPTVPDSVHPG